MFLIAKGKRQSGFQPQPTATVYLCNRPSRIQAHRLRPCAFYRRVPAGGSYLVGSGDPPAADALNAVLCHATRGKLEPSSIPPISDGQRFLPVWNKERL